MSSRSSPSRRSPSQSSPRGGRMTYEDMIERSGLSEYLDAKMPKNEYNSVGKITTLVDRLKKIKDVLLKRSNEKTIKGLRFRSYVPKTTLKKGEKPPTKIVSSATGMEKQFEDNKSFNLLLGYFGTRNELAIMTRQFTKAAKEKSPKRFMADILRKVQWPEQFVDLLVIGPGNDQQANAQLIEDMFPGTKSSRITDDLIDQHINLFKNVQMFELLGTTNSRVASPDDLTQENFELYDEISVKGRHIKTIPEKVQDALNEILEDDSLQDGLLTFSFDKKTGNFQVKHSLHSKSIKTGKATHERTVDGVKRTTQNLTVKLTSSNGKGIYVRASWDDARSKRLAEDLADTVLNTEYAVNSKIAKEYQRASQTEQEEVEEAEEISALESEGESEPSDLEPPPEEESEESSVENLEEGTSNNNGEETSNFEESESE